MRLCPGSSLTAAFFLGLSFQAAAETVPADCLALAAAVQSIGGYRMTAPPAGPEAGWCVLDGAVFQAKKADLPQISADQMRLRGTASEMGLSLIEVSISGLRIRSRIGDRTEGDGLREVLRLQTADLGFQLTLNPAGDTLMVRNVVLRLSGGTELALAADIRGAGLSVASLSGGSLTALELDWRNDGRLLGPVMEQAGMRLDPGLTGDASTGAARSAFAEVVAALPDTIFEEASRAALSRMISALPRGRGRLALSLTTGSGIGASRIILTAFSEDPLGPEAMARLLDGVRIRAVWQAGLGP